MLGRHRFNNLTYNQYGPSVHVWATRLLALHPSMVVRFHMTVFYKVANRGLQVRLWWQAQPPKDVLCDTHARVAF